MIEDNRPVVVYIPGFLSGGAPSPLTEKSALTVRTICVHPSSVCSIHDRVMQIFFELKGGTVNYGKAHSEFHGHDLLGETFHKGEFEGPLTTNKSNISSVNLPISFKCRVGALQSHTHCWSFVWRHYCIGVAVIFGQRLDVSWPFHECQLGAKCGDSGLTIERLLDGLRFGRQFDHTSSCKMGLFGMHGWVVGPHLGIHRF